VHDNRTAVRRGGHQGDEWQAPGCVTMRDVDPKESRDDHVELARGIAIGIAIGVAMWGLAALIVWALWR
jgi:hypothetical protein